MSRFFSRSQPQDDVRLSGSYSDEEAGLVDDVKKERKFVRKLDAILVTWAFFAYLLKVSPMLERKSTWLNSFDQMIDGTNYKTAYVSGMKEDVCPAPSVFREGSPLTRNLLSVEAQQQRTEFPRHLLPNRIRHLPPTMPNHPHQGQAELVVALERDGLGYHDR